VLITLVFLVSLAARIATRGRYSAVR